MLLLLLLLGCHGDGDLAVGLTGQAALLGEGVGRGVALDGLAMGPRDVHGEVALGPADQVVLDLLVLRERLEAAAVVDGRVVHKGCQAHTHKKRSVGGQKLSTAERSIYRRGRCRRAG